MRKERLIFFTNIPTPYQLDLFSSLSKIVHLTVVYSAKSENNRSWVLSDHKDYKSIYLDNNFFARIVQNKFVDFHYAGDLKKVLNNLKSDGQFDYAIVGGSYWNPNGVRQLYWARKNCRKVAYFSEPLYDTNSIIKKNIKRLFIKNLNKSIDYLFCIGQKAISTFLSYGITKPVVNIPYSIDNNKYDCSHSVQSEADGLVFLCAGALIYRKGIDIAIKAFKENRAFLNSKLLIIGGGELEFELKNLASDDSRVEFLGFLPHDEIVKYFNKADVFLFPSRYDGWGVVVMEAIASGCVVISSDNVGASLDLINSMENGILCKSESISEFANAINLLQSNIELYHSMKNSSMSLIHKVSSNYRAKQIMEIFNS